MARLFAQIFEHINYGGHYRWVRADVKDFPTEIGFNDKVSSIIVYKGNKYVDGDVIRFYQLSNFQGGYLNLGPGYYPNIHIQPYMFGDKISSLDFIPYVQPSVGLGVRLLIRVYQHINYAGQYRDVLVSESNLQNMGFNDKISSIRILAGEDYETGWVCDFFQHANYAGGMLQPGKFAPGTNIPSLTANPYAFNDTISSVKIFRLTQ